MSKKKAVVVGGAGFIGSHLTDALVKKGYDVHVIDNLVAGKKERVDPKATLHVLDIADLAGISSVIAGADYVFHLAALPRVQDSIDQPGMTHQVNVDGTLNVLLAAKNGHVGRVVFSASSAVYGDQDEMPLHEDLPAKPLSPYALHKYIGEQYARLFSTTYGLSTVSLRYFNVYGPRLDPNGAYALVIGRFLKQHTGGVPLSITGDGEQTRDFVHVFDVVRANILAAESERVGHGEVMNIGSGKNLSINRLAELIGGPVEYVAPRLEPKDSLASTKRAQELIGWIPEITIENGISDLIKEWR